MLILFRCQSERERERFGVQRAGSIGGKECFEERERERHTHTHKDNGEWRSERGGEPQRRRSGRAPGSSWLEEDGSVPVLLSLSQ